VCLGVPGRIVELPSDRPDIARADVGGRVRDVHVGLLDGALLEPGDWVVIHLGFALERMTEDEARDALGFFDGEESVAAADRSPIDGSVAGDAGPRFPPVRADRGAVS